MILTPAEQAREAEVRGRMYEAREQEAERKRMEALDEKVQGVCCQIL